MKKLTKIQAARWEASLGEIREAEAAYADARGVFESELAAAWDKLKGAAEILRGACLGASEVRDEVVSAISDYIADRSDLWQESDRGADYDSWLAEWEGADIIPYDVELPDFEEAYVDSIISDLEELFIEV